MNTRIPSIAIGLVLFRIAAATAEAKDIAPEPELVADPPETEAAAPAEEVDKPDVPEGMELIAGGRILIGDTFKEGLNNERPVIAVQVDGLFIDKHLVSKKQWETVHDWAVTNGYSFSRTPAGKAPEHPIHSISWHDAVKWCNARSEKEGLLPAYTLCEARTNVYRSGQADIRAEWVRWDSGYRLPTEAEWEKAARGGATGRRFAWSDADTIQHSRANYRSTADKDYDISPTRGPHPDFDEGFPGTSPVGHFPPNGYGLHDMTGNLWEWCWDWLSESYGHPGRTENPRGPGDGVKRALRGGSWTDTAFTSRTAFRHGAHPASASAFRGFRAVRTAINDE